MGPPFCVPEAAGFHLSGVTQPMPYRQPETQRSQEVKHVRVKVLSADVYEPRLGLPRHRRNRMLQHSEGFPVLFMLTSPSPELSDRSVLAEVQQLRKALFRIVPGFCNPSNLGNAFHHHPCNPCDLKIG